MAMDSQLSEELQVGDRFIGTFERGRDRPIVRTPSGKICLLGDSCADDAPELGQKWEVEIVLALPVFSV